MTIRTFSEIFSSGVWRWIWAVRARNSSNNISTARTTGPPCSVSMAGNISRALRCSQPIQPIIGHSISHRGHSSTRSSNASRSKAAFDLFRRIPLLPSLQLKDWSEPRYLGSYKPFEFCSFPCTNSCAIFHSKNLPVHPKPITNRRYGTLTKCATGNADWQSVVSKDGIL